jgi:hypothetical protein
MMMIMKMRYNNNHPWSPLYAKPELTNQLQPKNNHYSSLGVSAMMSVRFRILCASRHNEGYT